MAGICNFTVSFYIIYIFFKLRAEWELGPSQLFSILSPKRKERTVKLWAGFEEGSAQLGLWKS